MSLTLGGFGSAVRSNLVAVSQTNLAWATLLDVSPPDGGGRRLHDRLAHALRTAIRDGRLAEGAAVPPSRALAEELGCSRWVVTEAYGQLIAEGYLSARVGSATRVSWSPDTAPPRPRAHSAPARPPVRYDLARGDRAAPRVPPGCRTRAGRPPQRRSVRSAVPGSAPLTDVLPRREFGGRKAPTVKAVPSGPCSHLRNYRSSSSQRKTPRGLGSPPTVNHI
jgi:hypothetical protein